MTLDSNPERALLAVALGLGVALLPALLHGEPLLAGDAIAIGGAVGVAVYASGDGCCSAGGG